MNTTIPTQAEYEAREARMLQKQEERINSAPIADRRAAQNALIVAMRQPDLIQERAEWLLDGCYGFGACQRAARIQSQTRGNRQAALMQLLAIVEWQCPSEFARRGYNLLSAKEKRAVDRAVTNALMAHAAVENK